MPLPSNVQLENRGYRLLGNTAEIVVHPIAGLGVHEDKIKKDPDLIKRTIRASLRSLRLLQTNPKETIKILMDWVRVSERSKRPRRNESDFAKKRLINNRRKKPTCLFLSPTT